MFFKQERLNVHTNNNHFTTTTINQSITNKSLLASIHCKLRREYVRRVQLDISFAHF